jgi:hypothetical protein
MTGIPSEYSINLMQQIKIYYVCAIKSEFRYGGKKLHFY